MAALNDAFMKRSAVGLNCSISRAQLTHSASSSSNGTTLFTSPISSASAAVYWRHRYQISRAFFWPTMLAR